MNRFTILLFAAACVLFLAGCGQSSAEIGATVESQVAAAVMSTVEAWPTAVPLNTHTPVPSATPQATYTPYPTYTPPPTFTPQATYTPYPTWTPAPQDTATAVPTATATNLPAVQPTAVPPTTAPAATNNLAALKTEIANTLTDIDLYRASISRWQYATPFGGIVWEPVNCPENIAIRNRIVSVIVLDVSRDDQVVQDAYAAYQNAVHYFDEVTLAWTQGCQEAIANGETQKTLDDFQRNLLINEIATAQSWLNAANDQLNTSDE